MAISDYCRCDVLDTYFVFLRTKVLTGACDLAREQELVQLAKAWIEERADHCEAYRAYLNSWKEWNNPWQSDSPASAAMTEEPSA
jgi:hypothetical protein